MEELIILMIVWTIKKPPTITSNIRPSASKSRHSLHKAACPYKLCPKFYVGFFFCHSFVYETKAKAKALAEPPSRPFFIHNTLVFNANLLPRRLAGPQSRRNAEQQIIRCLGNFFVSLSIYFLRLLRLLPTSSSTYNTFSAHRL